MSLYQSGISPDVVINTHVAGRTAGGQVLIPFGMPLTFSDAVLKVLAGKVKLLGHKISGHVGIDLVYSNSGSDRRASPVDRAPSSTVAAEASPDDDDEESEEVEEGPHATRRKLEASLQEGGDEERAPRTKRVTRKPAAGASGKWNAGMTLRERLRAVNESLNKRYSEDRRKIGNWPTAICLNAEGKVRSRWTLFALLASTDVEFFRHLGYADHQIYSHAWEGKRLYALGQMPVAEGDVTAENFPNMAAVSPASGEFYYIPRDLDVRLRFQTYVSEAPATPAGLKGVLDAILAAGNRRYRAAVLEQQWTEKLVWPADCEFNWLDGDLASPKLHPANIFPIVPSYTEDQVVLTVNSNKFIGAVKQLDFEESNVFGFAAHVRTWNDERRQYAQTVVSSSHELGVRNQSCQLTSACSFPGRVTLTAAGPGPALCAVFIEDESYFPKVRLASSITYNGLVLDARSAYAHPSVTVSQEEYEYSLVLEIRNVY